MMGTRKIATPSQRATPEFAEGAAAAKASKSFDDCPYTFEAAGFAWANFNRAKLDAWFLGWQEAREKLDNSEHKPL